MEPEEGLAVDLVQLEGHGGENGVAGGTQDFLRKLHRLKD
jgi:hypothetical protein